MPKRIYLVSYNYPPMARTHSRYYFAKFLADYGYQVTVLKSDTIDGFLQKQSNDFSITEKNSKINEIPIPHTNYSFLGDILQMTGVWPEQCYNWVKAGLKKHKEWLAEPGIIFSIYPNLSSVLLGYQLAKKTGYPFVIDYRDEMLDILAPKKDAKRSKLEKMEKSWLTLASLISVSTPSVKKSLMERYALNENKITVTWNGFENIAPKNDYEQIKSEPTNIIYTGAISKHQRPEILAEAINILITKKPEYKNKVCAVFYGPDKPYYHTHFKKHLSENAIYKGFVPYQEATRAIQKSSIAFLSLADSSYAYAIPRKLFDYVNYEIPLLTVLPAGEAKNLVELNQFGYVCQPNDAQELSKVIEHLLINKAKLIKINETMKLSKQKFCIKNQIEELAKKLEGLFNPCVA